MDHVRRISLLGVLTVFVAVLGLGVYLLFFEFKDYVDDQASRQEESEKLLAAQQRLLDETQTKFEVLKDEIQTTLSKAQSDVSKLNEIQAINTRLLEEQQKAITKLSLPVRYTQSDVNLVSLTNESQVLKALSKSTRVSVQSTSGIWSTVLVGNLEGRIQTRYLADAPPFSFPDVSSIVSKWKPNMAHISCDFRNTSTGRLYQQSSGSGTAFQSASGIVVVTNKHVVTDTNEFKAYACKLKFVDSTHTFSVSSGLISYSSTLDWGLIRLTDFATYLSSSNLSSFSKCTSASDGDEVVILGYPTIGAQTGLTTTRGIISGRETNYYVTDAKIDQGNSGGAAILIKNNCYLGVPTFAVKGVVESLGRILDSKLISF